MYLLSQIGRGGAAEGLGHIAAGQPLHRGGGGAQRLLQRRAGAEGGHGDIRGVAVEIRGGVKAGAGAEAGALMRGAEVGLIVDIAEAEGAGVEAVFAGAGGGGDDRAVKLRMASGGDVKAAVAGKQPGLLAHRVVVAVLRQACKKLSARRQRQIAAFITAISTPQKRPPRPETVEWRRCERVKNPG
ncbi:hypothetical protein BTJ39_23970 [Izhakiella australiensis]|uniref:Uncharacterized protein n=1 Tax=Izhakiella australiensis TaxID=1926881 RepID=A0A1S8Y3D8_9GAMM|nr:hypothetical protein BTJ39_23970 [Izhakiella australiensis]